MDNECAAHSLIVIVQGMRRAESVGTGCGCACVREASQVVSVRVVVVTYGRIYLHYTLLYLYLGTGRT